MTDGERLYNKLTPLPFTASAAAAAFENEEPISVYQIVPSGHAVFLQVVNGKLYASTDGENYRRIIEGMQWHPKFVELAATMELTGRLGYYTNTIFQAYWVKEEEWLYFHNVARIINYPDHEDYSLLSAPAAFNLIEYSLHLDALPLLESLDFHPTHTETVLKELLSSGIRRYGEGSPRRNSLPEKIPGLLVLSELSTQWGKTFLLAPDGTKVLPASSNVQKDTVE